MIVGEGDDRALCQITSIANHRRKRSLIIIDVVEARMWIVHDQRAAQLVAVLSTLTSRGRSPRDSSKLLHKNILHMDDTYPIYGGCVSKRNTNT